MQEKENGVLEDKFKTYYKDVNIINYRNIFTEALMMYRGSSFKKVLDIGSGIGYFLDSIKPFGYELYALEASKYGIETLKEKNINVKEFFLEKDRQLPFDDNSFSLVVFNQVIEHTEKETGQYYIKEILRILEPGGVAIIKSPSYYSKIWRTDPHHIYCWKPNELFDEVLKYEEELSDIKLQRNVLEPWMLFDYNEKIIDDWHKYNKYPKTKRFFTLVSMIIDRLVLKQLKIDKLLSVSNVSFVKRS
jgi:SAM-dependent methyltransferase